MDLDDLDENQIQAIFEIDPTGALSKRLLEIFETDVPRQICLLEESLNKNNIEASKKIIHSIKSSCLNLGMSKLANHVLQLEKDLIVKKNYNSDFCIVFKEYFQYSLSRFREYISKNFNLR